MYGDIIPLLRCPTCDGDLVARGQPNAATGELVDGLLSCHSGHRIPVENGVVVLSRTDALSDPWSRSFPDYDAYSSSAKNGVTALGRDGSSILDNLPWPSPGPHLDICTGQGSLLFTMLGRGVLTGILSSVDMSLHAQTFNRRHLIDSGYREAVSFIACDACTTPFRSGVFASATACAMGNMLHKMPDGIRELRRLLQPGGLLVFDHIYVAEDSEGWRIATSSLAEMGAGDVGYLGLERRFLEMMNEMGFRDLQVRVTKEVVGDPGRSTESGIFPYPGETMKEVLVVAHA